MMTLFASFLAQVVPVVHTTQQTDPTAALVTSIGSLGSSAVLSGLVFYVVVYLGPRGIQAWREEKRADREFEDKRDARRDAAQLQREENQQEKEEKERKVRHETADRFMKSNWDLMEMMMKEDRFNRAAIINLAGKMDNLLVKITKMGEDLDKIRGSESEGD